jgi:hypothetical protein
MDSSSPSDLDFRVFESVPESPPRLWIKDTQLPLLSSIWFDGEMNVSNVPSSAAAIPANVLPVVAGDGAAMISVLEPATPLSVTIQRFDSIDANAHPAGQPQIESINGAQVDGFVAPVSGEEHRTMRLEIGEAQAITVTLRYAPFTAHENPDDFSQMPERTATWGFRSR